MRWVAFIVVAAACVAARGEDSLLHDFEGVSSLAAALRKSDLEVREDAAALGVVVRGPTAADQATPLMAEVRRRIEGLDVMAGVHADRTAVSAGPSKWVGGVGMAAEHGRGRGSVEVRTLVGQNEQWGRIGLEVGPRIERHLPGGITLFIDGKAEATSTPWQSYGGQSLPGTSDGLGLIGVTGRTGIVR